MPEVKSRPNTNRTTDASLDQIGEVVESLRREPALAISQASRVVEFLLVESIV